MVVILGVLGLLILMFLLVYSKSNKPNNSRTIVRTIIFRYHLKGNIKDMPVKSLENWKLLQLENHLYILEKTLDINLGIYDYLKGIWQGYYGKEVYIDVYWKTISEDYKVNHVFLGGFMVKGGKVWLRRKKF